MAGVLLGRPKPLAPGPKSTTLRLTPTSAHVPVCQMRSAEAATPSRSSSNAIITRICIVRRLQSDVGLMGKQPQSTQNTETDLLIPIVRRLLFVTWLRSGDVGEPFGEGNGRVVFEQRADDLRADRKAVARPPNRRADGGQAD